MPRGDLSATLEVVLQFFSAEPSLFSKSFTMIPFSMRRIRSHISLMKFRLWLEISTVVPCSLLTFWMRRDMFICDEAVEIVERFVKD